MIFQASIMLQLKKEAKMTVSKIIFRSNRKIKILIKFLAVLYFSIDQ